MIYQVVRIEEDIDFGCEERSKDSPVMAVVTLKKEEGLEQVIRIADQYLYAHDINEDDFVVMQEDGMLQKYTEEGITYGIEKSSKSR